MNIPTCPPMKQLNGLAMVKLLLATLLAQALIEILLEEENCPQLLLWNTEQL